MKKATALTVTCSCCGVQFDASICSQCQVAGCAAKGKREPCRLSSFMQTAQKMSLFQLQQRCEAQEKEIVRLTALTRVYETAILEAKLTVPLPKELLGKVAA